MLEIMSLQVYWKNEHWKVTPSIKSWHVKNCLLPQDVTFDLSLLRQPLLTPSLTYFYNPSLSWRYVVFVHRTGMTWPRDAPCKTNTSNRENAQRLQQQSSVRKVRQFLLSRKKMRIAVSASQRIFFVWTKKHHTKSGWSHFLSNSHLLIHHHPPAHVYVSLIISYLTGLQSRGTLRS